MYDCPRKPWIYTYCNSHPGGGNWELFLFSRSNSLFHIQSVAGLGAASRMLATEQYALLKGKQCGRRWERERFSFTSSSYRLVKRLRGTPVEPQPCCVVPTRWIFSRPQLIRENSGRLHVCRFERHASWWGGHQSDARIWEHCYSEFRRG